MGSCPGGAPSPSAAAGLSPTGGAYVYSLFGTCSSNHMAMLLTSASILRQTMPTHPVVAMLSPNCATEATLRALRQHAIEAVCVPRIGLANVKCEDAARQRRGYFAEHFTKLNIFALQGLRVALYLDSDVVVLRNIDHVLDQMLGNPRIQEARTPQGCMEAYAGRRWLNTGVWGVRPNATLLRGLVAWLGTGQTKCFDGDQSAAERYLMLNGAAGRRLDELLLLHVGYNMKANQEPVRCLQRQKLPTAALHAVHFSGTQKPHKLSNYSARAGREVRARTSTRKPREKMDAHGQSRQYYADVVYDPWVDRAWRAWMASWSTNRPSAGGDHRVVGDGHEQAAGPGVHRSSKASG